MVFPHLPGSLYKCFTKQLQVQKLTMFCELIVETKMCLLLDTLGLCYFSLKTCLNPFFLVFCVFVHVSVG